MQSIRLAWVAIIYDLFLDDEMRWRWDVPLVPWIRNCMQSKRYNSDSFSMKKLNNFPPAISFLYNNLLF